MELNNNSINNQFKNLIEDNCTNKNILLKIKGLCHYRINSLKERISILNQCGMPTNTMKHRIDIHLNHIDLIEFYLVNLSFTITTDHHN